MTLLGATFLPSTFLGPLRCSDRHEIGIGT